MCPAKGTGLSRGPWGDVKQLNIVKYCQLDVHAVLERWEEAWKQGYSERVVVETAARAQARPSGSQERI